MHYGSYEGLVLFSFSSELFSGLFLACLRTRVAREALTSLAAGIRSSPTTTYRRGSSRLDNRFFEYDCCCGAGIKYERRRRSHGGYGERGTGDRWE